jgi:hypothetical protein
MRTPAKKRLLFFITAVTVYILGFQFIPENLPYDGTIHSILPVIVAIAGYFVFLPILYWLWVIKAGKQKSWRMILIFSLSSVCARYSFPQNFAEYFEFIMYLRYTIIGVLIVIELYLMVMIIKGLWQARKLSGDPRVHAFEKYKDDEKKLALALPFSWEPASWYYAIPKFSKKHNKAIGQLQTKSIKRTHWLMLLVSCLIVGSLSYYLLVDWSEIVAIIIASLAFYSVIFITANHRVALKFSIYILDEYLIINDAFWSFLVVKINDVKSVQVGQWHKSDDKEQLMLGVGEYANIELTFFNEQMYLGSMGQFPETIHKLWLNVEQPQKFKEKLNDSL